MSAHSLLSPSSAARWRRCPGSVLRSKGLPDKAGPHAAEGSLAHAVAEKALTLGVDVDPTWVIEINGQAKKLPEDMPGFVMPYVAAVRSMTEGAQFIEYEMPLDLEAVLNVPGEKGTADVVAICGNQLQVHDLKYGKGVDVQALENDQALMYAAGALIEAELLYDIDEILIAIHQVRKKPVDTWTLTPAELWDRVNTSFKPYAARAIELHNGKGEPLQPGDICPGLKACRWCLRRPKCTELDQWVKQQIADEFDDLTVDAVKQSTAGLTSADGERYAKLLPVLPLVKIWLDAVANGALTFALAGGEIPDHKVVKGRAGNSAWRNPEEAEQILKSMRFKRDEMYRHKLTTPTAIRKVISAQKGGKGSPRKSKRIEPLIYRPEPKPALVATSDKREPVKITPTADYFENMDDGSDLV